MSTTSLEDLLSNLEDSLPNFSDWMEDMPSPPSVAPSMAPSSTQSPSPTMAPSTSSRPTGTPGPTTTSPTPAPTRTRMPTTTPTSRPTPTAWGETWETWGCADCDWSSTPAPSYYTLADDPFHSPPEYTPKDSPPGGWFLISVFFFSIFGAFFVGKARDQQRLRQHLQREANRASTAGTSPSTSSDPNETGDASAEEVKAARREHILAHLLEKEVLPKSHTHTALPLVVVNADSKEDTPDLESARPSTRRKSNIYASVSSLSTRSYVDGIRSIFSGATEDVTKSGRMSPSFCSICLEEYQVGEKIGWSKNEKCLHAFHKDCILEWLMKRDDCPICRTDYFETQD